MQVIIIFSQIKVNCMTVVRMRSIDPHGLQDQFGDSPASTSNVEQVRVGKAIYKYGSLFNHSCQPNIHAYFLSRTLCIRTTKAVAAGCHLELSYGPQVGLWDCNDRHTFLKDEYAFRFLESRVVDWEKLKIKHFSGADQVDKSDDIYQVCLRLFNQNGGFIHSQPGYCLKCGSYRDLESTRAVIDKAWICIKKLQDSIISKEISNTTISDALKSLCLLRLNLHAFNKRIAEAEDNLAQAFCIAGKLQLAMDHSKASLPLCSIQISMGDKTALDSISRICDIFSRY